MLEVKIVLVLTIFDSDQQRSSTGSSELQLPFIPFKGLNFGYKFIDSLTEIERISWIEETKSFRCEMKPIIADNGWDLPSFEEYIAFAKNEGWQHFDKIIDERDLS